MTEYSRDYRYPKGIFKNDLLSVIENTVNKVTYCVIYIFMPRYESIEISLPF